MDKALIMQHYCEFLYAFTIIGPVIAFVLLDRINELQKRRDKEELEVWWADIQKKLAEQKGRD